MKAILTVIGNDKPGIIACVSAALAEENVNIEDISQTVLQGKFTMIMVVNLAGSRKTLAELVEKFGALGKEQSLEIHLQHEDIFDAMYNI